MLANYSPDEAFSLFAGGAIALCAWVDWYYKVLSVGRAVRARGHRAPLLLTPIGCALLLYLVLACWSAEDVRTDPAYIIFYMVIGAAWVGLFLAPLPFLGLCVRDDALERGNDAAALALSGALVGGTCCFAGGNVGNGPGWWVVLYSAGLATTALLVLWGLIHAASGLAEKVSIERDVAAGLRAAGFLIGCGLILGRAVAGDWVSASATTIDFARLGWPALVLAVVCTFIERSSLPASDRRLRDAVVSGWMPAGAYVLSGVVVLVVRS